MVWRGSVSLILAAVLLVAALFAEACPPDPMWILVIYDADDIDDVVDQIRSATGLGASFPRVDISLPRAVVSDPLRDGAEALPAARSSSSLTRGPPDL